MGITPACAGKTSFDFFSFLRFRDHPRVCGKNEVRAVKFSYVVGSPPRVREKLQMEGVLVKRARITPACAGKTWSICCWYLRYWDHPRVCGKNTGNVFQVVSRPGSPPRVREKLGKFIRRYQESGITPACAGKTERTVSVRREITGSPPRVREKPQDKDVSYADIGITPACAGKTNQAFCD